LTTTTCLPCVQLPLYASWPSSLPCIERVRSGVAELSNCRFPSSAWRLCIIAFPVEMEPVAQPDRCSLAFAIVTETVVHKARIVRSILFVALRRRSWGPAVYTCSPGRCRNGFLTACIGPTVHFIGDKRHRWRVCCLLLLLYVVLR
jgi:hypothetical protein